MHKATVLAALLGLAAALVAAAAPNTIVRPNAVYARRGALGANDYVATNVAPCASAYALHEVRGGRLRDRAVNTATAEGGSAEFELPARRTVAGFARGLVLVVTATNRVPLRIAGAARLWRDDGTDGLAAEPGVNVFSFIEIGNAEYLVEARPLTRVTEED